jgi:hypothetical protein
MLEIRFSFSKHNSRTIQPDVNGAYIVDPYEVAEVSAEHFLSVYKISRVNSYHCASLSNDILHLPPRRHS